MFSDHLQQINSGKNGLAGKLFLFVGGLAIVGQLGAVAMVADGQMKKAEQRASRAVAEQVAVQHCLESSVGATRHSCLLQARVDGEAGGAMTASLGNAGMMATNDLAYSSGAGSMSSSGMSMVLPVNFMAR